MAYKTYSLMDDIPVIKTIIHLIHEDTEIHRKFPEAAEHLIAELETIISKILLMHMGRESISGSSAANE